MVRLRDAVLQQARSQPEGEPVLAKGLLHLGNRAAVDQTLSRLARDGMLTRICQGVYMPHVKSRFGTRVPNISKVIHRLAHLWGETIVPSGGASASVLGVTTQEPVRYVYLTSGPNRKLRFGNLEVELRHAPKWQLSLPNERAGTVIRALAWLGASEGRDSLQKIVPDLSTEEIEKLKVARATMPQWMAEVVTEEFLTKKCVTKVSLTDEILRQAQSQSEGVPILAKSLLHLGNRSAVDQALSRLEHQGVLFKVGWGLYVLPVETRFGRRAPSVEKTIDGIASVSGELIANSGAMAANVLGLTDQVSLTHVFLTSGSSRTLTLSYAEVELRHAPSWQLLLSGRRAGDAIRALAWLGRAKAGATIDEIWSRLSEVERRELLEVRAQLPSWLAALVSSAGRDR